MLIVNAQAAKAIQEDRMREARANRAASIYRGTSRMSRLSERIAHAFDGSFGRDPECCPPVACATC